MNANNEHTWYCPLPFKHAYIDSTGVSACCQTPRFTGSVSKWESSAQLQNLQQEILKGQIPAVCKGCVEQEDTSGMSLRTGSLLDYNNQRFTETNIDFIDYRANNICNFKCRSCDPVFSHGIANESKNTPALQKYFIVPATKTVHVHNDNIEWINTNLRQIKRLMLTGGEPTRMPEVRLLLERIMHEELEINILITTNASFEDDFWCELTRKSRNLHWTVSLDAVGESAEIIRHGTKWHKVERNIRWLAQHAESVNFNTVISNLNVLQLSPLLQFVNTMQVESSYPRGKHGNSGCRHQFHACQRPYYLSADNWPDELLPVVMNYLEGCLKLELDTEQRQTVAGLMTQIQKNQFDPGLWAKTQNYNNVLNQIRNEDHTILYKI